MLRAAFAAGLFLMVLGAKWAIVGLFSTELPYWDQWDAEGMMTLVPWFDGTIPQFLDALFSPHNEHLVVWTKLLALGEVLANGQWDARLESVVNTTLHAAFAAAAWLWLCRLVRGTIAQTALFVAVLLLSGLPLSWENLIGGFHSQQVLLLGFSLTAIALLVGAEAGSCRWCLGIGIAFAACFTMASGFFAAVVIAAATCWDSVVTRRWRGRGLTLVFMAGVVAIGVFLRVDLEVHQSLKAQSIREFILSLWRSLQWPVTGFAPYAIIAWAPWGLLVGRIIRRRSPATGPEVPLAAAGGWVLLQFSAAAYARGADGAWPAIRYLDTVGTGLLFNAAALIFLLNEARLQPSRLIPLIALAAGWIGLLAPAFWNHVPRTMKDLAIVRSDRAAGENAVHVYLATNDIATLRTAPFIPYPSADLLADRLKSATLRRLLPSTVRPALDLRPERDANFLAGHYGPPDGPGTEAISPATATLSWRRHWGSYGSNPPRIDAEWVSAPLPPPSTGWLKFETAGNVGEDGVRLELRDVATGTILGRIRPSLSPQDSWRAAYVRSPSAPFVVVAADQDPLRWLAFSAPVEMPFLSHLAWRASAHGLLLLEISAAAVAVFGLIVFFARKAKP